MTIREFTTKKNVTILMLCIGLIQIAGYYLAGMFASQDGHMAVPQPDTLLYCQAARRIVEGHPFSFSEGSAVSTGTTSVLYPFILAIPYALGVTGDSLFMAGFWLNAAFYLVFLLGWGMTFWQWLERPWTRITAIGLLALSGQPAFCAMAQSDIGCWMAVSALFAWGLSTNKPALYAPPLILAPWIRPEGMVCIIAFGIIVVIGMWFRLNDGGRPHAKMPFVTLLLSILSIAGVFILNYSLTGQAQFSSVANKGYFKIFPFSTAVSRSAADFLQLVNAYLLGLATSMPRHLIFPVLLAAVFIWLGILSHPWRSPQTRSLGVLILAAFGGILTVAQSGWQGTNFDRYLAWILPLYILFLAEGLMLFAEHFRRVLPGAIVPIAGCLIFFCFSAFVSICIFSEGAASTDRIRRFAHEIDHCISPTASVGSFGACGVAYILNQRTFYNLSGIYSPEFFVKTKAATYEILKHNPRARFDYWVLFPEEFASIPPVFRDACFGENVLTGPDGYEVRQANWTAYDHARTPHVDIPPDKHLVCHVDVGHEADELASNYEIIDRYGRPPTVPFIIIDDLAGKTAIDSARLLIGGDAMNLPLEQGKDVMVIMRTYPTHTETRSHEGRKISCDYAFANPLKMNIQVDGKDIFPVSVPYATNGFTDVSFTLPASAIEHSPCRLSLLGDHISAGYWFYQ